MVPAMGLAEGERMKGLEVEEQMPELAEDQTFVSGI